MCTFATDVHFVSIGQPHRIWAIPAIHGDIESLTALHDAIFEKFKPGDRIIYHGNYTGYGAHSAACISEILMFRRMILARTGVKPSDLIYLRGRQEEIWQKLLQIQFAPDPSNVLLWMLSNGLSSTLQSYGLSPHDGIDACRYGIMDITRWTNKIREAVRRQPGHEVFSHNLKRAAHTDTVSPYPMLFVHAGLNTRYSLEDQGENLWWAAHEFDAIQSAYKPFEKVVRGFDPQHKGLHLNCITATIDNGAGFGGNLISVGFERDGSVYQVLET
jgi:serine/threonine protein phosphatase 1